jgi:hypothetical protein
MGTGFPGPVGFEQAIAATISPVAESIVVEFKNRQCAR